MIRFAGPFALCLALSAGPARAEVITLQFEGVIESVVDANAVGLPTIDFTPIPAGSPLVGTYTYDTDTPLTNGGTGFKRYTNLLSTDASIAVNGHQFDSAGPGAAIVVSQEANFSYTGVAISTQPISLPAGWSVANASNPYFTIRFEDATPQTRSLDLPSSAADFPADNMVFVLDFQQSVTVDGVPYGGRVFVNGQITSLHVVPPPQEVAIDVDPSSADNRVSLSSRKPKPLQVALFGSAEFNVHDVDTDTIALGDPLLTDPETGTGLKAPPTAFRYRDVNRDGHRDLLLTFSLLDLQDLGAIDPSSTSLELQALLQNGGLIYGSDAVSISGGHGHGKK